jgi:hypothetical protein
MRIPSGETLGWAGKRHHRARKTRVDDVLEPQRASETRASMTTAIVRDRKTHVRAKEMHLSAWKMRGRAEAVHPSAWKVRGRAKEAHLSA